MHPEELLNGDTFEIKVNVLEHLLQDLHKAEVMMGLVSGNIKANSAV